MEQIERDILSACILTYENYVIAVDRGVTGEWFCENGHLFDELADVRKQWNEHNSVNLLSVLITKYDAFELLQPPEWAFSVEEMEDALEVFAGLYAKRRVQAVANSAFNALSSGEDPFEVAGNLRNAAENIEHIGESSKDRTTADIVESALEIDRKVISGEPVGLPLPWADIQKRTFGFPNGAYIPIGGRDGVCKSRLVTYISVTWVKSGYPILYFPFEDGAERFISNFSASLGGYDMFMAKRDYPPPWFIEKHEYNMDKVKGLPIYVEDYPCTAERIMTLTSKYVRKYGIRGVVVDGVKDVIHSSGDSTTSREGHVVSVLDRTAKKFKIPLIAISHIHDVEDGKWLSKRNIRGIKTQSQSSRMAAMVQDQGFPSQIREKYDLEDGDVILDFQKVSYGTKGIVALRPQLDRGAFEEIDAFIASEG